MNPSCNMLSFSADPFSLIAFLRCLVRKIIDVDYHCWFLLPEMGTLSHHTRQLQVVQSLQWFHLRQKALHKQKHKSQTEKQNSSCLCLLLCLWSASLQCKGLVSLAKDTALPFCFSTRNLKKESQVGKCSLLVFIAMIHHFKNLSIFSTGTEVPIGSSASK